MFNEVLVDSFVQIQPIKEPDVSVQRPCRPRWTGDSGNESDNVLPLETGKRRNEQMAQLFPTAMKVLPQNVVERIFQPNFPGYFVKW